jgi:hypothetical protein
MWLLLLAFVFLETVRSEAPQGIHLALTSSPSTSIQVSFFTVENATSLAPILEITSPIRRKIKGTTKSLIRNHHTIYVDDLDPSTTYSYIVYVDPKDTSETNEFTTKSSEVSSFVVRL